MSEDVSRSAAIPGLIAELRRFPAEWLAQQQTGRHLGPIGLPDRIVCVGECWRLGSILIGADGELYTADVVIRSEEEHIRGFTSELSRHREELRAAARRGRVPAGRTLNLNPVRLSLDEPVRPLRRNEDTIEVEWSTGLWAPLFPYLAERVALYLTN